MIAEVISIGDELTSGQRLDTNSQWLSQQLGDLGVKTMYHTTVADDLAANVQVFAEAIDRADIIVATGGLGPTADDLTREAIAKAAGTELVLDEPSLVHIQRLFARHKREMPQGNLSQAMFPRGSRPIPNQHGTAPGIDMLVAAPADDHFARLFALPGVPAEMKEMFLQTVAPAIGSMQPKPCVIRHRRIKCFGVGESQLEAMLPDLIARGREPSVGITVHAATITLRITAAGSNSDECFAKMRPTIDTIRQCLGNLVFGEEDDELADVVVRMLSQNGRSLATIELGTRGLLAHWLACAAEGAETPITSQVITAPHGIDATSHQFVEDLACSGRKESGVDYCLAISEFPHDQGDSKAVPTYHFALATPNQVVVMPATLVGHKSIWQPRAAKQALNLLRLTMLKA
jgi:nicotinamide-nucleotide amidase